MLTGGPLAVSGLYPQPFASAEGGTIATIERMGRSQQVQRMHLTMHKVSASIISHFSHGAACFVAVVARLRVCVAVLVSLEFCPMVTRGTIVCKELAKDNDWDKGRHYCGGERRE